MTFIKHSQYASHCCKPFVDIISLNYYNNPNNAGTIIIPILQMILKEV